MDIIIKIKKDVRLSLERRSQLKADNKGLFTRSGSCSLPNHLSGTKERKNNQIITLLARKITKWDIDDCRIFVLYISNLIGAEGKDSKYKIVISDNGDSYTLRISMHNMNANNYARHNYTKNNYGITFKTQDNKSVFFADDNIEAVEYVYNEEQTDKKRLKSIAKAILHLLETSEWDETIAPADVINHSPNGLGMAFIGRKAFENNDLMFSDELDALKKAIRMEASNRYTALQIKQQTGWERGADLKWRYEIPDLCRDDLSFLNEHSSYTLRDIIKPEMVDKFADFYGDELLNLPVVYKYARGYKGCIESTTGGKLIRMILNRDVDKQELASTINHELQHIIQNKEDFETGFNCRRGVDRYLKKAGEWEARIVQQRMNLTPEERRNILLSDEIDRYKIDINQLWFHRGNNRNEIKREIALNKKLYRADLLRIQAQAKIKLQQQRMREAGVSGMLDCLNGAETEHERKIARFIMEIGTADLTDEENSFYNAFIETNGTKSVQISDLLGLFNILKIIANNQEYGARHILIKHFGVKQDYVTADEIVKMGEIIKSSVPEFDNKHPKRHIYTKIKNGVRFRVIIDIDDKTGTLITFYSNR